MSQYKIGSMTATNGSADIVGVGTDWLTNVSAGDYFVRVGDNVSYEVGSVNSDTSISLTANYAGVTGSALSYVAHKDFHPNGAPKWSNADVEFAAIQNRWNAQSQPVSAYGSAAFLDSGTGAANLPTNDDLPTWGDVVTYNVGTDPGEIPTNANLGSAAFLNLNIDTFGGNGNLELIATGHARTTNIVRLYFPVSELTPYDSISGSTGTFELRDSGSSIIESSIAISNISFPSSTVQGSNKMAILDVTASATLIDGAAYTLIAETSESKIVFSHT